MSGTLAGFESEAGARGRAAAALRVGLRTARLAHAWLLYGPLGAGKRALARAFAAALLCPAGRERAEACGGCRDCRLVQAGTHPDLQWLEGDEAQRGARVQTLREAIAELALAPVSAPGRVLVIEQTDRLHPAAANGLLKTLEEPPDGAVIVLLTERVDRVLPTIRSRCRELRLPAARGAASAEHAAIAALLPRWLEHRDAMEGGAWVWAELAALARRRDEEAGVSSEPAALRARTRTFALWLLDALLERLRLLVREAALSGGALGPLENALSRVEEAARQIEGNAPGPLVLGVLAERLDTAAGLRSVLQRLSQPVQSVTQ
ncbi:MAG: AAA family ATPase [Planctomycetota bacterium]|nr:MAG: AAA family ATPase [Planctomycetota bacterium]